MGKKQYYRKIGILSFALLLTVTVGVLQFTPTTTSTLDSSGIFEEVNDTPILEELEIQDPISTHQIALDPPVYDYVDSQIYDGYGTIIDFSNMRSSSTSYATLTEAPSFTSTLDNENYWDPWMSETYSSSDWCEIEVNGLKDFQLELNGGQGGSTSNYAGVSGDLGAADSGGILSPTYDLSSAGYFVFSVYIYDSLLAHGDELEVYFRDSSSNYDRIFDWDDCEAPTAGWRYIDLTISDPQYLYNGFRVKYQSIDINLLQATGVDGHKIIAYGSNQLEQRFRFINVDYDEYRYEYLGIEFDSSVSESLIIECWDGDSWVQTGLKSSVGTSEMYIYSLLKSGTLDVRLRDYDTTQDTTANTWRIEELFVRMYDHIPENYKAPICDSFYDGDNIYAMKTPRASSNYAYITTFHSDADNYLDIDYCGLAGYNGATRLWEVVYSRSSDSYSLVTGSSYISIESGTEIKTGDTITIVWHIKFLWTHPDLLDMKIRVRTQDSGTNMVTEFLLGWDVETRLQSALEILDTGDDTRGEINGLLYAGGAVAYWGSLQYPPDNAVEIYIISSEVSASPWLAIYDNDMTGAQYWSWVIADDQVGLDYYSSKVVAAGDGSAGTDLLVTDDSVSYISDRITVLGYSVSDARVNVNSDSQINVTLEYDYDNTPVTTGTVQINGQNATHIVDGIWRLTISQSTVMEDTFDSIEVNSDTYGITVVNQNSQSISVIWDGLIIAMSGPTDSRVNIGDTATGIAASAIYSYDGASYDGTLVLNSTTYTYGTVGMRGYTVASASGDSFGITTILSNDETSCIWDIVDVTIIGSATWSQVDDSFQVWCSLQLRYDNHLLGAGDTVVIADQIAVWNGSYFIVEISYPTTNDRIFFVNSTIENTYSITILGSTESCMVHVTDIPSIVNVVSDFEAADGLYQGIHSEAPLWLHWDPINDPTPPSFIFTIEGAYIVSWNVTSSWSDLVLAYGNSTGTFICVVEIGLPYSDSSHTYTLFVVNEAGYSITIPVFITVKDYTVPVMLSNPDDINMVEGDTGFSIVWTCSDANPDSFEITLDGEIYESGAWTESIENFTVDLNGFEPGEYIFEITISDEIGNNIQDSVTVLVDESPTSSTTTTATTTNTTGTGTGDYLTIVIVAMFGGVLVIIIIIVIFMKKK